MSVGRSKRGRGPKASEGVVREGLDPWLSVGHAVGVEEPSPIACDGLVADSVGGLVVEEELVSEGLERVDRAGHGRCSLAGTMVSSRPRDVAMASAVVR